MSVQNSFGADTQSFDDVVNDAEFRRTFDADGMPPLYPHPPRWAVDDDYLRQLVARAPGGVGQGMLMCASASVQQRRTDAAFAHAKLIARQHKDSPPEKPTRWRQIMAPTGLLLTRPAHEIFEGDAPVDVDTFMRKVVLENNWRGAAWPSITVFGPDRVAAAAATLKLRGDGSRRRRGRDADIPWRRVAASPSAAPSRRRFDHFAGRHCPPNAKLCEACGVPTSCQCACGESYCSRACLRAAWRKHAPVCYVVARRVDIIETRVAATPWVRRGSSVDALDRTRAQVYDNGRIAYEIFNRLEFGPHRGPETKPSPKQRVCASCGDGGAKSRCQRCKAVVYCSRACQLKHWKSGHKESCRPCK